MFLTPGVGVLRKYETVDVGDSLAVDDAAADCKLADAEAAAASVAFVESKPSG